jgi:3-oxoacyl-[acyl-carrier protein] reductase
MWKIPKLDTCSIVYKFGTMEKLARELGPKKIRVNALNPGVVETEGTHTGGVIGSDFEAVVVAQTPLGRIGQPGDIGPIAVFLASDESGWLTGEQILASGGNR